MGVTYKLKDEVVHFIITQRQENPLASCRLLAESASQKFGLHLSKSSVHDVLKEFGIVTPRGRKPKDKFQIPHEKKKQIQESLSQVKLLASPVPPAEPTSTPMPIAELVIIPMPSPEPLVIPAQDPHDGHAQEKSSEYEGAGNIFLKAALWDLGIFAEEDIKEVEWKYYLTYAQGIKVVLENQKSFFIDLLLPLERCIREAADGLINNTRPLILEKVSDQELFQACMDAQEGFKMNYISIVGCNGLEILGLSNIVEQKRQFNLENIYFVESVKESPLERAREVFFSQTIEAKDFINNILNLNGFDITNKQELVVNLLVNADFSHRNSLQEAVEKLNRMFLRDDQGRLVRVKIQG